MSIRPALLAVGIFATLAVTGCQPLGAGADPSPSASDPAIPSPSTSASPSPSAAPASIPADCENVVEKDVYAATFADVPLNDPGFGEGLGVLEPTEPAAEATPEEILEAATELFCVWGDSQADITQLTASFGHVDRSVAQQYLGTLSAAGYTCGEMLGGLRCQRIQQNEQYPVEEGETVFLRDDVYIRIYQANFPTNNLLGSIVEKVWGNTGP